MTELQTSIIAVTVYPDRARVTRIGGTELEPGLHRLVIADLPNTIEPDSVRAAARGTARARLLGVDVLREHLTVSPADRRQELERQLEDIEDRLGYLARLSAAIEQEQAALDGLLSESEFFARGLAFGKTAVADLVTLLDGYRERVDKICSDEVAIKGLVRDLKREQERAQRELDELHDTQKRVRYVAAVEVEVLQAGHLTVELTAVVAGAGWEPLYDLRLVEEEQPALEVGYLAQVTQRTGEDWEDVALTLSTARPSLAETLPELDPWYVGPPVAYAAAPAPRKRAAPRLAGEMMMAAAPAPPMEVEEVQATVESSGTAVTYAVPAPTTIPADGAAHKVTVARFRLAPQMDYVTVPKLVPAAYRRAKVANESPYTLLPGAANIFAGDEFVGASRLELTAPGGELELFLGADDRLKVERELTRREVDKKLLRDRRRLRYGYEITLTSSLPDTAQVTVQDQIPVSRHEDIKVRLEAAEPRPTEQSDLNLLEWVLTLAPGEERTVQFEFTVEHPREMSVTGLP